MAKLCSVENCSKPVLARGWCSRHYSRWRNTGNPETPSTLGRWTSGRKCEYCEQDAKYEVDGKEVCPKHWQRIRKYGQPDVVMKPKRTELPQPVLEDGYAKLEAANKQQVLIDQEDLGKTAQHFWHVSKQGYPTTRIDGALITLHTLLIGLPPAGQVTDHINQNKLDNRKANLRFVSRLENHENSIVNEKLGRLPEQGGAGWDNTNKRWKAYFKPRGFPKRINVGSFTTHKEALEAVNKTKESWKSIRKDTGKQDD